MPTVFIGIGSNLGLREENCLKAIELLREKNIRVKKQSAMYETLPEGIKDQHGFINMAVETETDLPARKLLDMLKDIERQIGREEAIRWGPRLIDLDILLYDDLILKEPDLEIPHPLLHERVFVLKPLLEIAPEAVHPVLRKRIRELIKPNPTSGQL